MGLGLAAVELPLFPLGANHGAPPSAVVVRLSMQGHPPPLASNFLSPDRVCTCVKATLEIATVDDMGCDPSGRGVGQPCITCIANRTGVTSQHRSVQVA